MTEEEMKRLNEQIGESGGWEIVNEDDVLDPNFVPQVELKPCTEERAKEISAETFEPYAKQIRGLQYLKLEVEKLVSDWEKIAELSPNNPYTATTLEYLKFFLSEIERVMDGSLADDYEKVEKWMNGGLER